MARVEIRKAAGDEDLNMVRALWREYWDSFRLGDKFQGFAQDLAGLPGTYAPPGGALLLALVDGVPAGTIGLRPCGERSCEIKRLYVRPEHRGRGVARALFQAVLAQSRAGGYDVMYCDTLPEMTAALEMYRAWGFQETSPYSEKATPGAIYLKLEL
jgi:ribosomal protein S18 acetylase RimI-like enzyme